MVRTIPITTVIVPKSLCKKTINTPITAERIATGIMVCETSFIWSCFARLVKKLARYMIRVSFSSSEGWNAKGPNGIQRAAPLTSGTNNRTIDAIAVATTSKGCIRCQNKGKNDETINAPMPATIATNCLPTVIPAEFCSAGPIENSTIIPISISIELIRTIP